MNAPPANFDCADIYQEHGYVVRLTKGRDAKVQVFEVFGRPPTDREPQWAPETVLRCEMPRSLWDEVSPEARAEFNRRLKLEGKPVGRWGADETYVQRLFGKELLVLLWAIELPGVKPEETPVAIRNWLGLKPEERWWLYTMTAAATGLAHQVGVGWRGALRQALCFGTRSDAFNLGTVTGRGTLEPRVNARYVQRRKRARHADEPDLLSLNPGTPYLIRIHESLVERLPDGTNCAGSCNGVRNRVRRHSARCKYALCPPISPIPCQIAKRDLAARFDGLPRVTKNAQARNCWVPAFAGTSFAQERLSRTG